MQTMFFIAEAPQDISQGILARFQLELCNLCSVGQRCVRQVDKCLAAYVAHYSFAQLTLVLALFILHVNQVMQLKTYLLTMYTNPGA